MKETPNTEQARAELALHTNKPIRVVSMDEAAQLLNAPHIAEYGGVASIGRDYFLIGLNFEHEQTSEATFVHEVQHLILREEGFPEVDVEPHGLEQSPELLNNARRIANLLGTALDHPEVYRRMGENYELDLGTYYKGLERRKKDRLAKKHVPQDIHSRTFSEQQDILDALDYYHYLEPNKKELLDLFRETSGTAAHACAELYKKLSKNGMSSPDECRRGGEAILEKLINYGERKQLPAHIQQMWKSLKIA
jgi:hypothetical protein